MYNAPTSERQVYRQVCVEISIKFPFNVLWTGPVVVYCLAPPFGSLTCRLDTIEATYDTLIFIDPIWHLVSQLSLKKL